MGLKVAGRLQGAGAPLPPCQQQGLVQAAWTQGCHTQLSVELGGHGDSEEEGRALTLLDALAPWPARKDLTGCVFPPHPGQGARILPTLPSLGEIISLFLDTLNFPLAFPLVLGYKESQKSPKISTKKKSLPWMCW